MYKNTNHFFIIGAQRSGTTYLYKILDEHPEIEMAKPVRPEPKFFINSNNMNMDYYKNKYFKEKSSKTKIFGEKSTSYYEYESVAQEIKKMMPKSKIIFLLRDPVYRAISNYFFSVANGLETRTLEQVFLEKVPLLKYSNKLSTNPFDYIERSKYIKYIKKYLKFWGEDEINIIIFEEFVNNIQSVQNLYSNLQVNNKFIPNGINIKINQGDYCYDSLNKEVLLEIKQNLASTTNELEQYLNKKIKLWV